MKPQIKQILIGIFSTVILICGLGIYQKIFAADNYNDKYTKSLLHMDGSDGSATFTDTAFGGTHIWTANGAAQIDTAYSVFGGASGLFPNANVANYISAPDSDDWNFGYGDFTIDFWLRYNSITDFRPIMGQYTASNNWSLLALQDPAVGYDPTKFTLGFMGASQQYITWTWSIAKEIWYHIEIVRHGNNWYLFVNGAQAGGTQTNTDYMPDVAAILRIGSDGSGWKPIDGWLDEVRISKGTARHITSFTPPNVAYDIIPVMPSVYNGFTYGEIVGTFLLFLIFISVFSLLFIKLFFIKRH